MATHFGIARKCMCSLLYAVPITLSDHTSWPQSDPSYLSHRLKDALEESSCPRIAITDRSQLQQVHIEESNVDKFVFNIAVT